MYICMHTCGCRIKIHFPKARSRALASFSTQRAGDINIVVFRIPDVMILKSLFSSLERKKLYQSHCHPLKSCINAVHARELMWKLVRTFTYVQWQILFALLVFSSFSSGHVDVVFKNVDISRARRDTHVYLFYIHAYNYLQPAAERTGTKSETKTEREHSSRTMPRSCRV